MYYFKNISHAFIFFIHYQKTTYIFGITPLLMRVQPIMHIIISL